MRKATLTTLVWTVIEAACAVRDASACPSCYGSVEKNVLDTYYLSTMMLSLLPFGIVAAIAVLGWMFMRSPAPSSRNTAESADPEFADNTSSVLGGNSPTA